MKLKYKVLILTLISTSVLANSNERLLNELVNQCGNNTTHRKEKNAFHDFIMANYSKLDERIEAIAKVCEVHRNEHDYGHVHNRTYYGSYHNLLDKGILLKNMTTQQYAETADFCLSRERHLEELKDQFTEDIDSKLQSLDKKLSLLLDLKGYEDELFIIENIFKSINISIDKVQQDQAGKKIKIIGSFEDLKLTYELNQENSKGIIIFNRLKLVSIVYSMDTSIQNKIVEIFGTNNVGETVRFSVGKSVLRGKAYYYTGYLAGDINTKGTLADAYSEKCSQFINIKTKY